MNKLKLGLGTEVATEITFGDEEKVFEVQYMGEVLKITTIGDVVDVDVFNWFQNMQNRLLNIKS